jgi:serine/threonine-protein kinase
MNTPSTDPAGKNTSDYNLLSSEHLLQPGDRVGHCRVIDLIAAGGMANVYKVWHEQLEVVRAIKILKPGYTEESKGRLEMEAKISANLRHPNIVDIYYMGYWNTIPYIEMEYIDGPSLKDLIESRTRLSIPLSISIAHMLCIALKFAYNQDMTLYGKVYDRLIHRDLKPANILISSKGTIKLADFGIARPSEVSIHTVGSKIMGTFAYLSPEQLSGEKLDQRSDIYALGAVLYEMISGVKTFPQKLLADLVQKKSKGYFTPVGSMGLTIPKSLTDIIEKCLQLDKNKRYSDIADLDEALISVFKRHYHKDFDEILKSFQSEPNPSEISNATSKPKNVKKPLIIALISMLAVSVALIFLFMIQNAVTKKGDKKLVTQNTTFSLSLPDTPKTDLVKKTENTTPSDKAKRVHLQIENQQLPRTETHGSTFQNGLEAFKSGNYSDAVSYLKQISSKDLDIRKVNTAKTLIFESLLRMQDYERASEIAEKETIESAHFYLLKGELYFQQKKSDDAINAINKALTFENIESAHLSRLRLLKARTSEQFYNLKPNADNMKRMSDDWKAYLDCCCQGNPQSKYCQEAQDAISRFSF